MSSSLVVPCAGADPPSSARPARDGRVAAARHVDADQAFSGFGNEAPIVVAALLVFARAADVSGLVRRSWAARGPGRAPRDFLLARILALTDPIASGVLNNTTLVAMAIPAAVDLATADASAPARLLMPISFAAVLGGVITLIGTSTNLTVSGLLREAGHGARWGLFELTPVGLPIALVGTAVLVLTAGWLLPDRGSVDGDAAIGRDFSVSMTVQRAGPLVGQTVEGAGLRRLQSVYLVAIERDGERIAPVSPNTELHARDLLTFVGAVDQIVDLQRMRGLTSAERGQIKRLPGGPACLQ